MKSITRGRLGKDGTVDLLKEDELSLVMGGVTPVDEAAEIGLEGGGDNLDGEEIDGLVSEAEEGATNFAG